MHLRFSTIGVISLLLLHTFSNAASIHHSAIKKQPAFRESLSKRSVDADKKTLRIHQRRADPTLPDTAYIANQPSTASTMVYSSYAYPASTGYYYQQAPANPVVATNQMGSVSPMNSFSSISQANPINSASQVNPTSQVNPASQFNPTTPLSAASSGYYPVNSMNTANKPVYYSPATPVSVSYYPMSYPMNVPSTGNTVYQPINPVNIQALQAAATTTTTPTSTVDPVSSTSNSDDDSKSKKTHKVEVKDDEDEDEPDEEDFDSEDLVERRKR